MSEFDRSARPARSRPSRGIEAGGACLYLADMADFATMNSVYAAHFDEPFPARTTIQAAALPLGALVEIEVIAR